MCIYFFFSSRRRHTRCSRDWSSDVCSSDLLPCLSPPLRKRSDSRAAGAGRRRGSCAPRTRLPSVSRAHPRQPGTRGNLARRVAQGAVSGNGRCHRGTPQIRRLCLRYPGSRRLSTGYSQRSAGPPGAVIAQKSLRNIMDCFCVAVGGSSEELFGVSLEEEWPANRIAAAPCCSSRPLLPLRAVTRAHMSTEAFPAPTRYRALSVWSSTMPRARWISQREQPEWCRFTPRYAPPVSDLKIRNIVWTTWCRILP